MSRPPLHVVAAVLRDAQGRVLLAQRPSGKADAGLWEFPGGKVEAGESAFDALRRELREELGVSVTAATPLNRVPVADPGIEGRPSGADAPLSVRLHLDTWQVAAFDGEPVAREHAALVWVDPAGLCAYPMPPADRPVVAALRGPDRLLITPEPGEGPQADAPFMAAVDAALAGGLRRVQLRMAPGDPARLERLVAALAPRIVATGADLRVHGIENAGLALRAGLGLHLRARDLVDASSPAVRPTLDALRTSRRPLSASVHDVRELALAEAAGAEDLLLGPVKATATHPGQPGLGWAGFEALRARTPLPVFALGGLGDGDLDVARRHGAQGVAGIRAFWPGR